MSIALWAGSASLHAARITPDAIEAAIASTEEEFRSGARDQAIARMSAVRERAERELGVRSTYATDALLAHATLLVAAGRASEAEALYTRGIAARANGNAAERSDATAIRIDYLKLLSEAGRANEALPIAREVLAAQRARFGDDSSGARDAAIWLARLLRDTGDLTAAESHARAALRTIEKDRGRGTPVVLPQTELLLADILARSNRPTEARALATSALTRCEHLRVTEDLCGYAARRTLAMVQSQLQDSAAAEETLRGLLAEPAPEGADPDLADALGMRLALARALLWQGKYDGVAAELDRAGELARQHGDMASEVVALYRAALAVEQRSPDESQAAFDEAIARAGVPRSNDRDALPVLATLVKEFADHGRPTRAAPFVGRMHQIVAALPASAPLDVRMTAKLYVAAAEGLIGNHDEAIAQARAVSEGADDGMPRIRASAQSIWFAMLTATGRLDDLAALCVRIRANSTETRQLLAPVVQACEKFPGGAP